MTLPDVSVVLPVRDGEAHLQQAIESSLSQTFDRLELIVVDDGSRDRTASIVASYAAGDSRLRPAVSPERGIVAALNHGCRVARAPLIARMDADDVSYPTRVARQGARFELEPALVLVACAIDIVDAGGRTITVRRPASGGLRRALESQNPFVHSSVMFRAAAFKSVGGYRPEFEHAEDYDLWLRLAEQGEIDLLSEPLLAYRYHGAQASARHLRDQARAMVAAQACARARQGLLGQTVSERDVDQRAASSVAELAGFALDAGDTAAAKTLLATIFATRAPGRTSRSSLSLQRARLELRGGHRLAALLHLGRAFVGSPTTAVAALALRRRRR